MDVFYCADGEGCIAFHNLCDGFKDCRDGSDECLCNDVVNCVNGGQDYCIPRSKYCKNGTDTSGMYTNCLPSGNEGTVCKSNSKTLHEGRKIDLHDEKETFFENCFTQYLNTTVFNYGTFLPLLRQFFKTNCNRITGLADYVRRGGGLYFFFSCSGPNDDETESIGLEKVCDGIFDCGNKQDESSCPGMYACAGNNSHVIKGFMLCDNHKDCPLGDDECQNCTNNGISSDTHMVKHRLISNMIILQCVLIIAVNLLAVWDIYKQEVSTKAGKIDRGIKFLVCFYDSLTGLYMLAVLIKSQLFKGKYCSHDFNWRSSVSCQILGFLFTFSAHGSLFTISTMSFIRCYKCVSNRTASRRVVTALLVVMSLFNAFNSVLPILPLSAIQDTFRAGATFLDNPFISVYNKQEIMRIYRTYFGEKVAIVDTYSMLKKLNTISTRKTMFNPVEIGYYSYSSLCIHNIFGTQESFLWYQVMYMVLIALLLLVVSISYTIIVYNAFKISRTLRLNLNNPIKNHNTDLSTKVVLMIGSQLCCWITVMGLMIISKLNGGYTSNTVYEFTAIVLIPFNSYLNPIFNSNLYKKALALVNKFNLRLASFFNHSRDPDIATVYINSGIARPRPRPIITHQETSFSSSIDRNLEIREITPDAFDD